MECTIYLTEDCNLRCSYCYEGENKRKKTLSSAKLRQSIDFIVENNPIGEDIHLTFLGGEPLLNKGMIFEFINIIEEEHPEIKHIFKYAITTNGILLNEKLVELFKEYSFNVSISIDGDKETHNLNRVSINGKDVYDTIISKMQLMQERSLDFSVRMTVTQNNVSALYSNVCYFYEMGIKKINIGMDTMADWTDEYLKILDEQYTLLDELYLNTIADSKAILNLYDFKMSTFVAARTPAYCSGGSKGHLVINSEGELFPCGFVVNNPEWNLGKVVDELDKKSFLNTIRKNVVKKSLCHDCEISFTCSGAKCGFYNYMKTGKLNVHTAMTCKLEKLLYNHNLVVIKELYKRKHRRLYYYLEIAERQNIKLSPTMLRIIDEAKLQKIG